MLQKELAKRLRARYDTKMDGNEWMEVSSDGIPLCRIKYNGQFLSNADQNLSDEYRSKIADIQDEISTVREYVGLYPTKGEIYFADARTIDPYTLPDIDLICGGFPCQSFSIAGLRRGFQDDTRGTLFFEIARIAAVKRPPFLLLENVPGLLSHDQGRTFATILGALDELG